MPYMIILTSRPVLGYKNAYENVFIPAVNEDFISIDKARDYFNDVLKDSSTGATFTIIETYDTYELNFEDPD